MNREIKFRGKYGNCWVFGSLLWYADSDNNIITDIYTNEVDVSVYRVIPETVGQYTGLKDKNGTEIYEGDIIKFLRWFNVLQPRDMFIAEVTFQNYMFYANYQLGYVAGEPTREVIGNIHDNPELMKGIEQRHYGCQETM